MRCHGKMTVKFLSILFGATFGFLLYRAQHSWSYRYTSKEDRNAQPDLYQSDALEIEQGVKIVEGKEHPLEPLVAYEGGGTSRKHGNYVTISPNNKELTFRLDPKFKFSTCPSSLQTKLSEFSWSASYYHPSVQLIMTKALIDQEEYNRLEPYWMPFGFHYHENFTYEELNRTLSLFSLEENVLDFKTHSKPACVSCAVVGNGGILNDSGMGKEIDQHDLVFRVNNCIRRGHELDVGTRTTHYVFMDRSLRDIPVADVPKDEGLKWIFLPCRKNDFKYISEVARGNNLKQKLKAKAEDIRLLHPDFVRYAHKVWMQTKSFRPSTGAMMLMTALHAGCDRLSVYGMGFNSIYSEHYYDKKFTVYRNVKGSHDFAREIEIMKRLDRAGIIKWYKRNVPEFLK